VDRRRLLGIALTVVSACAFGSGALFAKPVYALGVDWLTLLSWRFLIGAALAWVALVLRPEARRALRVMRRREALVALGLGAWYVINSGTYYASLETVPASLASLLVYTYPAIVAVLALRLGRPLEGRRAWGALALALLGVVLAVGGIDPDAMPPVSGLVLAMASPVIYAVWIILSARLAGERTEHAGADGDAGTASMVATPLMMTATAAVLWMAALAVGRPVLPGEIPTEAWAGLIGVGLVATFIAIQTFYAGTQRIGAAQASLVSTVEPVWTIVLASLLLGEHLAPIQLVGGALILTGVVIAQTRGRSDREREEAPLPQPTVRLADD
jgi:drug/metabolite transporter (DMT)-like permease